MIRNCTHIIGLCFILGLCLAHVSGCALGQQWLRQEPRSEMARCKESCSRKATDLETQGELRQALFAWQVAARIDPEETRILEKIQSLETTIAAAATESYERGVEYYQKRDLPNARLQFLKVIHLVPDHPKAQHYLRSRLHTAEHATYRVQRGDSFTKIANDIYKDVSKAYIIAYFNDLDPHRPLYIGTLLVLPELSPAQLLPRRDLLVLMDQARKALGLNRYTEVLSITERISSQSPGNAQAQLLADTARFNLAKAHLEKGSTRAPWIVSNRSARLITAGTRPWPWRSGSSIGRPPIKNCSKPAMRWTTKIMARPSGSVKRSSPANPPMGWPGISLTPPATLRASAISIKAKSPRRLKS
jgi:tetratricopeptide (TPR) repeat protein